MTENRTKKSSEEKDGMEMLAEIGRLLLLLLWKVVRSILRIIIKSIILFIRLIKKGIKRCVDFWNDNDTQEKLHKAKTGIKKAAVTFRQWLLIASATIIRLTILGARNTIQGIIHLKPTIIKVGICIKSGCISFGKGMRLLGRSIKLSHIRRKRAYKNFRKNKGFKGLLKDFANLLKSTLNNYMEEEQAEAAPETITEDDIIAEKISNGGKAHVIGKKLFSSVKNIVDISEDKTEK